MDPFGIVGESVAAWTLRARVQWCGRRNSHTLVTGPSGSGKELTASALHAHSARAAEPFVARNATTLPESLLDAELFGHAANYPQSGMPARPGLVGAADRGTLFLDEIGELPAAGQAHLLRLLDSSGEYHRLGETRVRHADVRVIAATNRDPESLRHDLLPRFLLRVHVPGLQARREDIPLLVRYLSEEILRGDAELAAAHGPGGIPVDCTFLSAMLRHEFTHHVRELASLMWLALGERPEVLALTPAVEARIRGRESTVPAARAELPDEPEVRAALAANEGNRTHAAEALGISRFALLRLLKRFDS